MIICKYWIEYSNKQGDLFEFCRKRKKKCVCSGVKEQCDYLEKE